MLTANEMYNYAITNTLDRISKKIQEEVTINGSTNCYFWFPDYFDLNIKNKIIEKLRELGYKVDMLVKNDISISWDQNKCQTEN